MTKLKKMSSHKFKNSNSDKPKKSKSWKTIFWTKSLLIRTTWQLGNEWDVIGMAFCDLAMFLNGFEHPPPFFDASNSEHLPVFSAPREGEGRSAPVHGLGTLRTSPQTQKKLHGKGTRYIQHTTYKIWTDIATTRPNWPSAVGRFGEKTI